MLVVGTVNAVKHNFTVNYTLKKLLTLQQVYSCESMIVSVKWTNHVFHKVFQGKIYGFFFLHSSGFSYSLAWQAAREFSTSASLNLLSP